VLGASIESKTRPGDFNWDPANIRPKSPELLDELQTTINYLNQYRNGIEQMLVRSVQPYTESLLFNLKPKQNIIFQQTATVKINFNAIGNVSLYILMMISLWRSLPPTTFIVVTFMSTSSLSTRRWAASVT